MLAGTQRRDPTIEMQLRAPEHIDDVQFEARQCPLRIRARLKESESLACGAGARGLQVAYVSENYPALVPQVRKDR
jgi:hypothetical protein